MTLGDAPAVSPFVFRLPTELRFGAGRRREVGDIARRYGTRIVLVSGANSFDGSPHAAEILDGLAAAGVDVVARLRVPHEPDSAAVDGAAITLREASPDAVIAVGGGSALDLAKGAGAVAGSGAAVAALWGAPIETPWRPLICLPTTAGSGAEASWGAVILDTDSERKRALRGPGIAAAVAIVDPEMTLSSDGRLTAEAGFDALAHAVETAVSRAAQPMTLMLSARAIAALLEYLPVAITSPFDPGARSENAYAALLMGINLANSTTCLPHRLQYPVGALTRSSHGRGVAALFPAWLEQTIDHAPASLARLARAASSSNGSDSDVARALAARILELRSAIGLDVKLAQLGIDAGDVPELVAKVEGTLANDPGPSSPDDLAQLYLASL